MVEKPPSAATCWGPSSSRNLSHVTSPLLMFISLQFPIYLICISPNFDPVNKINRPDETNDYLNSLSNSRNWTTHFVNKKLLMKN